MHRHSMANERESTRCELDKRTNIFSHTHTHTSSIYLYRYKEKLFITVTLNRSKRRRQAYKHPFASNKFVCLLQKQMTDAKRMLKSTLATACLSMCVRAWVWVWVYNVNIIKIELTRTQLESECKHAKSFQLDLVFSLSQKEKREGNTVSHLQCDEHKEANRLSSQSRIATYLIHLYSVLFDGRNMSNIKYPNQMPTKNCKCERDEVRNGMKWN